MASSRWKGESGPLTLGQALAAHVRLIVWCKSCNHRANPDIAAQVAQHGSGLSVIDWARLLRCTECTARDADFVVAGGEPWTSKSPAIASGAPVPGKCSEFGLYELADRVKAYEVGFADCKTPL